ncbi:MAG: molybdopterin dehydrogenase [Tenericutes bacterium HGW-Tenericutes-5]|jgi:CO/xanthine dehydrogenase FAD-binding subunit|nr:MAG: molybdopterin dehydrogenase [Tenericutes bacterium HGW-Tenericutes-5]
MVTSYIPLNLDECLKILSDKQVRIVAGGTDMLIQNRSHTSMPIGFKSDVCYISNIEELKKIYEDETFVYIGSVCSLEAIMESELVPELLKNTILEMASPAIRHTATLAGNIGNASPAGDSLVPLYLLDALVEKRSIKGVSKVALSDFITGVRKIDLEKDELITKVIIPKISFTKSYFKKVGPRLSDAISKLSFAGAYKLENDLVKDIRIAFGSVNVTVVRRRDLEERLIGKTKDEVKKMVSEIVDWYEEFIKPIDDQRSNKEYRKSISLKLLRSFIENIE